MNDTIPFKILDIQIAHHTPSIPNPMAPKSIAKGSRSVLNTILVTAGGTVRPMP